MDIKCNSHAAEAAVGFSPTKRAHSRVVDLVSYRIRNGLVTTPTAACLEPSASELFETMCRSVQYTGVGTGPADPAAAGPVI